MLTAISVLDSLIRAGMRHVVLSPGSRSAPLAYALAAAADAGVIVAHVRVDERTAGFTALGIAKATGAPVGLICTSGTAAGEYVPAVMEAYHSGIPLAIMTADRPASLRGTGANQTTVQPGMFSSFVRASADLVDYPEDEEGQQTADFSACLSALTGRNSDWLADDITVGPAHINICLPAPLTPSEREAQILPLWASKLAESIDFGAEAQALESHLNDVHYSPGELMFMGMHQMQNQGGEPSDAQPRTVILAADQAPAFAAEFATMTGLPLLAEPSSNVRDGAHSIAHYPQILASELGGEIERVVLFGHPTLTRPVTELLARESVQVALYAPTPASWYESGARGEIEISAPAKLYDFAMGAQRSEGWTARWEQESGRAQELFERSLAAYRSGRFGEEYVEPDNYRDRTAGRSLARWIWSQSADEGRALVVGSSNLIRDLDFAAPVTEDSAPYPVYANRGLAGIDGTLATAIGISLAGYYPTGVAEEPVAGEAEPVTLLCGDLTFQHDIASLNLPNTELLPDVRVHVFDDAGGGIFTTLEHGDMAKNPQFTSAVDRFFTLAAAENRDLKAMVAGFGATPGNPQAGIEVHIHTPFDVSMYRS